MSETTKAPLSKLIPLTAGTITIVNFFFSLIPVADNSPDWFNLFVNGINPEFKFIVFTLLTLVASFSVVKFIVYADSSSSLPSSKMTLVSILSVSFAWLVVFNIKLIALSGDISGMQFYVFLISAWVFSFFLSIQLHSDFKSMGYELYGNEIGLWLDKGYSTPIYIRTIRFIAFWFIIILGGIFYQF